MRALAGLGTAETTVFPFPIAYTDGLTYAGPGGPGMHGMEARQGRYRLAHSVSYG